MKRATSDYHKSMTVISLLKENINRRTVYTRKLYLKQETKTKNVGNRCIYISCCDIKQSVKYNIVKSCR